MNKKLKSILYLLLSLSLFTPCLFSQTLIEDAFDADVQEAKQRTIVIVDIEHHYDLNPHTANYSSEAQVLTGLYEGLFSYDPVTLEPVNALCESYKVSRDKKRWTFTLKKGCTFSDGKPITAQSIKDSWLSLLSNPNATFSSLIDCISGAKDFRTQKAPAEAVRITVRDDYTLVVHLNEPTEHLTRILCHHAFSAVSAKEGVYSGPFVLASYKNNVLELVKNPYYHDAKSVLVPGITIIQSDDPAENAFLFNTGAADWITGNASAEKVLNKEALHLSAEFGTSYLFFKIGNAPWNNTEFRRALLEAIPYDVLRENYAVPAKTLIYPLSGYPTVYGFDDYDEEDAIMLMNKAREKAGIPLEQKISVVLAISSESDYMRTWAEVLKKAWEPLGVRLVTQATPSERYNDSIASWNADIFSYSWIGDFADPLAFLELFRGDSTLNVANYKNDNFDALLQQAAVTDNVQDRLKVLARAEQLLLDDSVIIPIMHSLSLHIIDTASIGGWHVNALDIHPLKYLYLKQKEYTIPNMVHYLKK